MLSYDAMIQARKDPNNLTKFNTLAEALRKEIYNLRNFYYYQTHVATQNEGVKIEGWMGNEISCEGIR